MAYIRTTTYSEAGGTSRSIMLSEIGINRERAIMEDLREDLQGEVREIMDVCDLFFGGTQGDLHNAVEGAMECFYGRVAGVERKVRESEDAVETLRKDIVNINTEASDCATTEVTK